MLLKILTRIEGRVSVCVCLTTGQVNRWKEELDLVFMLLRMKLWLTSPAHKQLAAKKTIRIIFFSEKCIINSLEISCYNWGDFFPDKWCSAEIHFQETIKHRAKTREIIWEDVFQSAFASVLRDKKVERQVYFQSGKARSPVHKGRGAAVSLQDCFCFTAEEGGGKFPH